jgi:hypothetical protein
MGVYSLVGQLAIKNLEPEEPFVNRPLLAS